MAKKKINIVQEKDAPVNVDILAKSIKNISDAVDRFLSGQLNENAIVILLSHHTKEPQSTIRTVLRGIKELPSYYCK